MLSVKKGGMMFRAIIWPIIFFVSAMSIAIQPACQHWQQKPLHKLAIKMR